MATRSHTTFKKRQKELARLEKQREKVAKRAERKLTKLPLDSPENIQSAEEFTELGPELTEAPPTD